MKQQEYPSFLFFYDAGSIIYMLCTVKCISQYVLQYVSLLPSPTM